LFKISLNKMSLESIVNITDINIHKSIQNRNSKTYFELKVIQESCILSYEMKKCCKKFKKGKRCKKCPQN
jgi:hypothetical protein